jgi:hypothetical protein
LKLSPVLWHEKIDRGRLGKIPTLISLSPPRERVGVRGNNLIRHVFRCAIMFGSFLAGKPRPVGGELQFSQMTEV